MIGVELVKDRATGEPDGATAEAVAAWAAEAGPILLTCGVEHQVIRWILPINGRCRRSRRPGHLRAAPRLSRQGVIGRAADPLEAHARSGCGWPPACGR